MLIQIASDLHLEHYCIDFFNLLSEGIDIVTEDVVDCSHDDGIISSSSTIAKENMFWEQKQLLQPEAPTLALLGDMSNCTCYEGKTIFESFLRYYSPFYRTILFIAGNHEYYCASYFAPNTSSSSRGNGDDNNKKGKGHMIVDIVDVTMVDAYLNSLSQKFDNFHFLNQTRIDIENVAILGCTLWSAIPDTNPRIQIMVESFLNDYRQIYVSDEENLEYRVISGDDTHQWFCQQVQWIEQQLARIELEEPNKPVLVLTHHGPMLKGCSHPRYENQKPPELYRRHGFVSDLMPLLTSSPNLKAWFYGHTHYNSTRILDNGVLVSSNQRGYADHILKDYRPDDVFEVGPTSNKKRKTTPTTDEQQATAEKQQID